MADISQITLPDNNVYYIKDATARDDIADLSAAMPTKTSDLTNDSGFLTSIPKATDSTIGGIIASQSEGFSVDSLGYIGAVRASATSDGFMTSGQYSKLAALPTATELAANYQAKLVSGTNIKTINNESLLGSGNITISGGGATYSDFTGATSTTAGTHGLVPQPDAGDQEKFLSGGGTWKTITIPIATSSTVGSVKPGTGLSVNANGSLSVSITSIIPVSFTASGWVEDSTNGWKIQTVTTYTTDGEALNSLTPILRSAAAIAVDLDMSSATITTAPILQNAWALVGRVYSDNSGLHAICYDDAPTVTLPLNLYVTVG